MIRHSSRNKPASSRALHEAEGLPGVVHVEGMRAVGARLRSGHRYRNLAVMGLPASPTLNRIVDRSGQLLTLPPDGLVISKTLAGILDVRPGQPLTIEVLEGQRPVRQSVVVGLVDEMMGLSAYMERGALHRLLREGETLSGAYLQVDDAALPALNRRIKATPRVAALNLSQAALRSFRDTMAQNMWIMIGANVLFAGIIAAGVVYNAARVSLSERSRELASLRVIGFTRAEISLILLLELAILTLGSLPIGAAVGYGLSRWMFEALQTELYRFPTVVTPSSIAWSALTVLAAAAASGLLVRRKLDRLDLVAVLKTRE